MARRGIDFNVNTRVNTLGLRKARQAFQALSRTSMVNIKALNRQTRLLRNMNHQFMLTNKLLADTNAKLTGMAAATGRTTRKTKRLTKAKKELRQVSRTQLNIMQRLITVMAVFGGTGYVIRGFKNLVSSGIQFNKTMESAQLGIAALISATGQVVNKQGAMVSMADKFAWAQEKAREQVMLLRKDALNTEATFQELMNVYQLAIAPGISGGLDLGEIRKFSVRISQAATALQMPQRQLAEEVRSILRGNIRLQSTRIAAALNITNQQVKKWREMGTLGDELFKKFSAFGEASKKLRETWLGMVGRVKDAFQQLAGTAGLEFFTVLKDTMKELFHLMVNVTDQGISLNNSLVEGFRQIFNALRDVVVYFKQLASAGSAGELSSGLGRISDALRGIGIMVVDVLFGIKDGLQIVGGIVALVRSWLSAIGKVGISFNDVLRKLVAILVTVTAVNTAMKLFKVLSIGVRSVWRVIAITLKVSKKALALMAALTKTIVLKWGIFLAALYKVAEVINSHVSKELGISADFVTQLTAGFRVMGMLAKKVVKTLTIGFENAFNLLQSGLARANIGWLKLRRIALQAKSYVTNDYKQLEAVTVEIRRAQRKLKEIDDSGPAESIGDIWRNVGGDIGKTINDFWLEYEKSGKDSIGILKDDMKDLAGTAAGAAKATAKTAWGVLSSIFDKLKGKLESKPIKVKLDLESSLPGAADGLPVGADDYQMTDVNISQLMAGTQFQALEEAASKYKNMRDNIKEASEFLEKQRVAQERNLLLLQQQSEMQGYTDLDKRNEAISQLEQTEESQRRLNETKKVEVYLAGEALRKQREQFELLKLQAEGGPFTAMEHGLLTFAQKAGDTFQGISNIISQSLNALAETISTTIVDAFDPTKKVNIKERFARLLQSIAKMAIQTFMKIAMAKAIAGIFGGAAGGAGGTVAKAVTKARGGTIPGRGRPSLGHYFNPQGLAAGGRPTGLHPTDTIPIWAAPGEFMMRVDAVRKYGSDVMAKINAGLVDPAGLRGLAGSVRSAASRGARGLGFAEGGELSSRNVLPAQSGGGVSRAVVVADDDAADKILNGGRGAFLRFLAENRDDINGSLRT